MKGERERGSGKGGAGAGGRVGKMDVPCKWVRGSVGLNWIELTRDPERFAGLRV